MENESGNSEPIQKGKGKKKEPTTEKNNQDIRLFFNKSTGPSVLTTNKRIIKVIEPYLNEINEDNYKLRERKIINYKHKFEPSDESEKGNESENDSLGESDEINSEGGDAKGINEELSEFSNKIKSSKSKNKLLKKRKRSGKEKKLKGKGKKKRTEKKKDEDGYFNEEDNSEIESEVSNQDESDFDYIELRGVKVFRGLKNEAIATINEAEQEIKKFTKEFYANEEKISQVKSKYPDCCVPISADIREFKFRNLAEKQFELAGQYFDVIMMDPPWQLSSSQPTRGVAIAYDTLNDNIITDIPVEKLQTDGFIFIWTINAKFKVTLDLLKNWGYRYCDQIVWVKQTVNGKIAKGHGYYLQHTKETCLIGVKGNPKFNKNVFTDVIFSRRRGQSQKPEEIYEIIERLIPNGYYLEIFGRRNNLRNFWVTIGNEI